MLVLTPKLAWTQQVWCRGDRPVSKALMELRLSLRHVSVLAVVPPQSSPGQMCWHLSCLAGEGPSQGPHWRHPPILSPRGLILAKACVSEQNPGLGWIPSEYNQVSYEILSAVCVAHAKFQYGKMTWLLFQTQCKERNLKLQSGRCWCLSMIWDGTDTDNYPQFI